MLPHSAKPRFEVRIMAPFSYLVLTIWKKRLAPPALLVRNLGLHSCPHDPAPCLARAVAARLWKAHYRNLASGINH